MKLLGDDIDTTSIKKNTESLIDVNEEVGLEANAEKVKYKLLPRHQNAGQNNRLKMWHSSNISE
jgi:coproporphyrinogen III oxidase-like Fe-S oxidoreductase